MSLIDVGKGALIKETDQPNQHTFMSDPTLFVINVAACDSSFTSYIILN